MYSFIKPRTKRFFEFDSRIWLTYIAFMTAVVLAFNGFLQQQYHEAKSAYENDIKAKAAAVQNIENMKEMIAQIETDVAIYDKLSNNNIVFKDSIKNLFDLIPEQVILTNLSMDEERLNIKGYVQNRDIYNYLLGVPLKSIFHTSSANFYPLRNGWLSFNSINTYLPKESEGAIDENE